MIYAGILLIYYPLCIQFELLERINLNILIHYFIRINCNNSHPELKKAGICPPSHS